MDVEFTKLHEAISMIESFVKDPTVGLPEEVFLFVSRTTPMLNVDLLIKDNQNRTLLTWREDEYVNPGWHVPGGIVRFKEKLADRIRAVALYELGAKVKYNPIPLAVNEVVHPSRNNRGHFISLLYDCRLLRGPLGELQCVSDKPAAGQWAWHTRCPDNIIKVHEMYREYF
jgi:ADP-ribose pyrophosphatase YjhB (NUDIX family)